MSNTYGVTDNGIHYDTSKTLIGAKNYATRNGFKQVSVRFNYGYVVQVLAEKVNGKWKEVIT
jgi:hypothetical protein